LNTLALCLCGSGETYPECCAVYHTGEQQAPTAETLMRSRFTAFAMRNEHYLLATWDTTKRPQTINFSKDETIWQRLEIVNTKKGGINDSKGIVEFRAYYQLNNNDYVMKEISRFRKEQGQWLYLDGAVKSVEKADQKSNTGRNAACPCGSGKKFKRCCGKREN